MFNLGITRRVLLKGGSSAILAGPMFTSASSAQAAPIRSAASFIESVGVNTHLSSEPYASRFELVRELLANLRLRHVRDELRPKNDLNRWKVLFNQHAIKSHLLVSPATNTVAEMMRYLAALGIEKVSAIEGQNEGDADWFMAHKAARGQWDVTVVEYQREIFQTLRAKYPTAVLPIVSPSVINWKPADMKLIRGSAEYCDVVAIHSYVQHGEEPETNADYAALSWYFQNMRDSYKPGAPVMSTETGYNNTVKPGGSGVSELASAIYIPRLLLNNFLAGVQKTFLYQLLDGGDDPAEWEHHFGLVRHDDTPKPVYHAIATLLGALQETGNVAPSSNQIPVAVRNASPEIRFIQFEKADGSTVVALWRAVRCWDVELAKDIAVTPMELTLTWDRIITHASHLVPNDGKIWSELPLSRDGVQVSVGAKVVLVRLSTAS